MKTLRLVLASLLAVVGGGAFAVDDTSPNLARVEINFATPQPSSDSAGAGLSRFKMWAEQRAAQFVPANRRLIITITSIDMSGRLEPWRGSQYQDTNVVRDVYAPSIDLQFKLVATDGTTLSQGGRQLRSAGLPNVATSVNGDDALRFDKALFEDWLAREFPHS